MGTSAVISKLAITQLRVRPLHPGRQAVFSGSEIVTLLLHPQSGKNERSEAAMALDRHAGGECHVRHGGGLLYWRKNRVNNQRRHGRRAKGHTVSGRLQNRTVVKSVAHRGNSASKLTISQRPRPKQNEETLPTR